jgi:hypothetical protein
VFVLPFSKFQKYFYFLRYLHQKFPDGIVCTDDNYSCQYDIKIIYELLWNILLFRQICPIIEHNTALWSFFPLPNFKSISTFYVTYIKSFPMALFVRMIIIAVNMTLRNNIFHSNSYIILICVMCLVVDTRYILQIKI